MFLRHSFAVTIATILLASAGRAQEVTWSAPVLGYIFDGTSGSIKTIAGVPGAASVEAMVASGVKLQQAHIAPGRKFAIVETLDEGTVLLDWSNGDTVVRSLSGAIGSITAVAFSPSGSTAAIVSRTAGKVQVWRGLPNDPGVQREIASEASGLAIADDGSVATIQADGVYSLDSGEPRLLASGEYAAIAFRPGTNNLAAAGRFSDSVTMLRTGAESSRLASADDGVAEPVGLQFSSDGTKLVIANRRNRSVTVANVNTGRSTSLPCECDATVVSATSSGGVFRITDSYDQPIIFLDANSPEPRLFVVPVSGGSR